MKHSILFTLIFCYGSLNGAASKQTPQEKKAEDHCVQALCTQYSPPKWMNDGEFKSEYRFTWRKQKEEEEKLAQLTAALNIQKQ